MALSVKNMLGGSGGLPSYPYVWERYNYEYVLGKKLKDATPLAYNFAVGGATLYHGKMYTFGSAETPYSTSYSVWNESENQWDVYTMPYAFTQGCVLVYDDKIHLLGGSGTAYTKHYTFDGTTFEEDVPIPYNFYRGCAVIYNDEIHILSSGSSSYANRHYRLDKNSNTWVSVATLPKTSYSYSSAIVYNNVLYLMGGTGYPTTISTFSNGAWVESTMPCSVNRSCVLEYEGKIHVLGGNATGIYRQHYTFDGDVWEMQDNIPYDFSGGSAVIFNGELHLLGSGLTAYARKNFILYGYNLETTYIDDITSTEIDAYPSKGILGEYYYIRGNKPLYSWEKYDVVNGEKIFVEYTFDKDPNKYPRDGMHMGYYYESSKDIHIVNGNTIEAYAKNGVINASTFVEFSVDTPSLLHKALKSADGPIDNNPVVFEVTDSFGIVAFAYSSASYHYLYCFCYNINEFGEVTMGNVLNVFGITKYSGENLVIYKIDRSTVGIVHSQGTNTTALAKLTFTVGDVNSLAYTGTNPAILSSKGTRTTSTMLSDGKILVMYGYSGWADLWIYDPTVENFTTTSPKVVIDNGVNNTSYGASFSKPIGEDRFILTYSHGYALYMCICTYDPNTGDVIVTSKTLLEDSASNYRQKVDIVLTSETTFDVFCMLGDGTSSHIVIPCRINGDDLQASNPVILSTEWGTYMGLGDVGNGIAVILGTATSNNYATITTYLHGAKMETYRGASTTLSTAAYPTNGIHGKDLIVFLFRNSSGTWYYISIKLPLKIEALPSTGRCDGITLTNLLDSQIGQVRVY